MSESTFDFRYQSKIINLLLFQKSFLERFGDVILPEYFSDVAHQKTAKLILDYWKRYQDCPTMEALIDEAFVVYTRQEDIAQFSDVIQSVASDDVQDAQYYEDRVIAFCRAQAALKALRECADDLKTGSVDEILPRIDKALSVGEGLSASEIGLLWSNRSQDQLSTQTPMVPTLLGVNDETRGLDAILGGGLEQGSLGIVMAPTGKGKSVCLLNFAGNAVLQGYNVAYISLELSEKLVTRRFDMFFTRRTKDELLGLPPNEIYEMTREVHGDRLGELVVKTFPTKGLSVRQLEGYLKTFQRYSGWVPDLLIVDYMDIMKPPPNRDRWIELEEISNDLCALAGRYQFPIWTASQVNRVGMVAKNDLGTDLAAGSVNKLHPASVILTFPAPKPIEGSDLKSTKLFVKKSRNDRDDVSLSYEIDFARMRFIYQEDETPAAAGLSFRTKFLEVRNAAKTAL